MPEYRKEVESDAYPITTIPGKSAVSVCRNPDLRWVNLPRSRLKPRDPAAADAGKCADRSRAFVELSTVCLISNTPCVVSCR